MVRIPQHGPDNSLFDIVNFLPDIDSHFSVDSWQVCIDQCLGMGAVTLEQATAGTLTLPDAEFRSAIALSTRRLMDTLLVSAMAAPWSSCLPWTPLTGRSPVRRSLRRSCWLSTALTKVLAPLTNRSSGHWTQLGSSQISY